MPHSTKAPVYFVPVLETFLVSLNGPVASQADIAKTAKLATIHQAKVRMEILIVTGLQDDKVCRVVPTSAATSAP